MNKTQELVKQILEVGWAEVVVTPDMARELLGNMPRQRGLSNYKVDQYAGMMQRGEWVTGPPIAIDRDGNVIEGQHRLRAVVKINKPVKFIIIAGLAPEAIYAFDRGRGKTLADMLTLRGEQGNTRELATALGWLWKYKTGQMRNSGGKGLPSIPQAFKPRLDPQQVAETAKYWRQQQRDLQSVDDLVGNVVGTLADTNQLHNTYVVYTSDNGYLLYRHRVKGKGAPYEESIGVPLIVRGPGVPHGTVRGQIVANTDWAPTIAHWARVQPPDFVDGRSFSPLLSASPPPWRKRLLIEWLHSRHAFRGMRTSDHTTYVEYETGEHELYRLDTDPYQLENAYGSANSATIARLEDQLKALKHCARAQCAKAEDAP